jgi:hypothetical protein
MIGGFGLQPQLDYGLGPISAIMTKGDHGEAGGGVRRG